MSDHIRSLKIGHPGTAFQPVRHLQAGQYTVEVDESGRWLYLRDVNRADLTVEHLHMMWKEALHFPLVTEGWEVKDAPGESGTVVYPAGGWPAVAVH